MNWLTKAVRITVLVAVLVLGGTTQGRTQSLNIVVIDSLWGAAVGGVAGLSIGLLSDDDNDLFSDYVAKGAGVGAVGGLLYGLFSSPSPYYGQMYLNNGQPKGLLHFDADENLLAINLGKVIPRRQFDKDLEESKWRLDLFTTTF
ncbi:MAG: hypothetical protein Q3M24_03675 [Candidatus Electrothrix aestuarii]|uniref:Glycine zipper n=1 Tax=Candidatus Electrothrix aestuarii TaxID=3062594 RepID=A0AAU8LXA9_9BACT|nr:hypothetical protein [Candidatus Electrothrix aestuarii]WPD22905.1 MAG: hypothetical protein SD837_22325 [Candidatus Electrothrix sp. GW3-3]